jgi:hypothetical protein
MFRGILASYLLLVAMEMHQHQLQYASLVTNNIKILMRALLIELSEEFNSLVMRTLPYYSKFIVAVSLATVCGMKMGQRIGWVLIITNLVFLWSQV